MTTKMKTALTYNQMKFKDSVKYRMFEGVENEVTYEDYKRTIKELVESAKLKVLERKYKTHGFDVEDETDEADED